MNSSKEGSESQKYLPTLYINKLIEDDNSGVALFNSQNNLLLRTNNKLLDFLHLPYNTFENCIGQQFCDIMPKNERYTWSEVYNHVIDRDETFFEREMEIVHPHRGFTYWDICIVPLKYEEEITYIVLTVEEVTERVVGRIQISEQSKMLEELERALKIKDEFFAFLSHEFKTPLTVINAVIQTMELKCRDELSRKVMGYLSKIKQNVFRQMRLINNLLDFTKAQSGYINVYKRNMDIVFLTQVITESVTLYAKMKGLELRFISSIPEKIIAIDDEKYERIILNLLSNAIKFTPYGKCISVKLTLQNRKVEIKVEDEGIGIPEEKLGLIFDSFGQVNSSLSRDSEGTGLGLALVKLMVKALGGQIEVSSEEKKGSTFKIVLPDEIEYEVKEKTEEKDTKDNRLIQAVNIEFSDLYMY